MSQVISTPSKDATLYVQQTQENEVKQCELAVRKISVATMVGRGSEATLSLQHYQQGRKEVEEEAGGGGASCAPLMTCTAVQKFGVTHSSLQGLTMCRLHPLQSQSLVSATGQSARGHTQVWALC